ncbi:O-antigen ligase family protein [Xylophilus sp. Kf1]|nr:O-antigen ligase family protein [Xylophilus sp. Kf1]
MAADPFVSAPVTQRAEPRGETVATPGEQWLARLLVVASFVFCFLPPDFRWTHDEADFDFTAGSLATQIEFGSIFLLGAWLAWRHPDWTVLRLRQTNLFLVVFIGWCLLSTLWSGYPVVSLKRASQLVGFFIVGLAISPPVGGSRQLLQVLMATLTVLLAISVVVVVVNPTVGIDRDLGNAWRGMFLQKNTTGAAAAICALLWLRECVEPRLFRRGVCVAALLFCLGMLVMAKSSTSLLMFLIGSAAYLLMRRQFLVLRHPWWVMGLAVVSVLALGVHVFFLFTGHLPGWNDIAGTIGRAVGKDADFTGRTDIWELVLLDVQRHVVLGTGYGAFWLGLEGPARYVAEALYWIPLQSHNGYLDILNELGVVGLVLAACVFVRHAMLVGRLMAVDREEASMHAAFFVILLASNVTESEVFRGFLFYNILFFYSAASVASQVALARLSADDTGAPAQVTP